MRRKNRPSLRQVSHPGQGRGRLTTSACRARRLPAPSTEGLLESGVDVVDIGLLRHRAGVLRDVPPSEARWRESWSPPVTTPKDYNGLKFVREQSRPISSGHRTGGYRAHHPGRQRPGRSDPRHGREHQPIRDEAYVQHLLSDTSMSTSLKPLKVVVNAGNGGAGVVIDLLEKHLPFEFIKLLHHEPDGNFPQRRAQSAARRTTVRSPPTRSWRRAPTSASPGTATSIAVSFFDDKGGVHRGLLHRRFAGAGGTEALSRCGDRLRPAADVEHDRDGRASAADARCSASRGTPSSRR